MEQINKLMPKGSKSLTAGHSQTNNLMLFAKWDECFRSRMQAVEKDGEINYSLCLYRDQIASETEITSGVRKLMAVHRHEKDASFWAVVHQTISDQKPTKQQLNDIINRGCEAEYLTIKALKHDKRIRLYDNQQAMRWFNQNISGSENNHMLLYFYAYPKEKTGGVRFYSLWSDVALSGADVATLKRQQAEKFGYKLK